MSDKNNVGASSSQKTGIFIVLGVLIVAVVAGLAFMSGRIGQGENDSTGGASVASDESSVADSAPAAGEEKEPQKAAAADETKPEPLKIKEGNPVVAKVDGKDITRLDVLTFIQGLPPNMKQMPVPQLFPLAQQQVVNATIVQGKADAANIGDDPAVKEQLAKAKEQIIRNVYIQREVDKAVTEDKVKKAYDEYLKTLGDVDETHARHILVDSEDKARDVIAKLDKGEAFEKLAEENSTGPTGPKGGDLGWFTKEEMVPEFADVAFKLKPGTYTKEPVKTQFGWHVIKVEERRKRPKPKFDDVKGFLEVQVKREILNEMVEKWRKAAKVETFDINGDAVPADAGGDKG